MDRIHASWRAAYVSDATEQSRNSNSSCVFCDLIERGVSKESGIVFLDELVCCILNAYPYGSGHLLILPRRHEAALMALSEDESDALWRTARAAVGTLERAYDPDGVNLGANLGEAAGAGIPAHLHLHALPRWSGDTNFMTSISETRVLPESLAETWDKVTGAWENPGDTPSSP
jgi:diadenosine tetraphosphate (Ap4A) HIT family hydrolase